MGKSAIVKAWLKPSPISSCPLKPRSKLTKPSLPLSSVASKLPTSAKSFPARKSARLSGSGLPNSLHPTRASRFAADSRVVLGESSRQHRTFCLRALESSRSSQEFSPLRRTGERLSRSAAHSSFASPHLLSNLTRARDPGSPPLLARLSPSANAFLITPLPISTLPPHSTCDILPQ
jgi:hypothetical protein